MPTMRTRAKCSIPITNPNPTFVGENNNPNVSVYEKCREDRIKENLQRMQNLGILDLSLKLKSQIRPIKRSYTSSSKSDPDPDPKSLPVSTRRSSRLKKTEKVTYFEEAEVKKSKEAIVWLGNGERSEIYTEEHEKLLGNTDRSWELFVDGCDVDGKRIYDPVRGKTCHQCRQKTLGYRTRCSLCYPSVTGQFCGDCLYMRYGEHVVETLENPDWICPGCRGICNCSICRKSKGFLPTGNAYRKICKLGYKSVAHYLIQTNKQSETSEDNHIDDKDANKTPDSARILSLTDNQTSVIDVDAVGDDLKPLECSETDKEKRETRSKRRMSVEPNPNSIGGRLRQRRRRSQT